MGINHFTAPLSKINDGMNDITIQTADKSRWALTKWMLAIDDGEYFNKQTGKLKETYEIDYVKSDSWELKPERKGPVPEGSTYRLPAGVITNENNFFSIDGEKYPAQNIKGKVLKQFLPVYY